MNNPILTQNPVNNNTTHQTSIAIDTYQSNSNSNVSAKPSHNFDGLYYTSSKEYSGISSIHKMHTQSLSCGAVVNEYPFMEQVHCNWPNRLIKMSEL